MQRCGVAPRETRAIRNLPDATNRVKDHIAARWAANQHCAASVVLEALGASLAERRPEGRVSRGERIDVGAVMDQKLQDRCMPHESCNVHRGDPVFASDIDVTSGQQSSDLWRGERMTKQRMAPAPMSHWQRPGAKEWSDYPC